MKNPRYLLGIALLASAVPYVIIIVFLATDGEEDPANLLAFFGLGLASSILLAVMCFLNVTVYIPSMWWRAVGLSFFSSMCWSALIVYVIARLIEQYYF